MTQYSPEWKTILDHVKKSAGGFLFRQNLFLRIRLDSAAAFQCADDILIQR